MNAIAKAKAKEAKVQPTKRIKAKKDAKTKDKEEKMQAMVNAKKTKIKEKEARKQAELLLELGHAKTAVCSSCEGQPLVWQGCMMLFKTDAEFKKHERTQTHQKKLETIEKKKNLTSPNVGAGLNDANEPHNTADSLTPKKRDRETEAVSNHNDKRAKQDGVKNYITQAGKEIANKLLTKTKKYKEIKK